MVMMSTTTMIEVVVNTIQKGLKYFLSVPKEAGSLFTPVICLRTKKPCMRCIFAFSCQHPPVHVSVYRCVCIAELVMVGDATTMGISQITLRMVTVTDLESKMICTHCIFAFFSKSVSVWDAE